MQFKEGNCVFLTETWMHVHHTERQQVSLMFTQKLGKVFPAVSVTKEK